LPTTKTCPTVSTSSGSIVCSTATTNRNRTLLSGWPSSSRSVWLDDYYVVGFTAPRKPSGSSPGSAETSATTRNCLVGRRSTSGRSSISRGSSTSPIRPSTAAASSTSRASHRHRSGPSCPPPCRRRLREHLLLFADLPVPSLSEEVPLPLHRRVAGEGH